jgi:asparagine synthase (glutamine-hydrolysing)
MSGITGIFRRDGGDVDPDDIKKMNDKIAHRGPDGSKIWCEGPVAFGHQMLHTTQESLHEELPFENKESGFVITSDARIDNRKELAPKLGIEDNEFISDSYFILKSYEKWGEKCPEELLGDFAFAIWDKNKEKLFCARDHMGVKPFYYYLSDDIFVFGTEIKSIFSLPGVPLKLNELKIAFYLIQVLTEKKLTFYEKIFSLTAAYSLSIGRNTKIKQKYWELNSDSKITMNSEEEYITAFRNIFSESIRCRLRSAFPIGFELSGGLDSSSVVCMAKNVLKDQDYTKFEINTYSMIFEDIPQTDESYYIQKVVDIGGINSNLIPSDKISPLENIGSVLWYQDQPFNTVNIAILSNMYKKMQNDGMRIILGGNGGDEIISYGTNYFTDLFVALKWKTLINELFHTSKRSKHNFFHLFFSLALFPLLPFSLKELMKNLLYLRKNKEKKLFILNKNFAEKLGGELYLKSLTFNPITSEIKTAKKYHHFMISKLDHQYLEMVDRLAAAFSTEPRYPFLDKRLIEFCYAIPTEMKFKSGWGRYILRVSMKNILPKEVQWRYFKKYFDPVLEKNLLYYEENSLKEVFSTTSNLIKDYINFAKIPHIYREFVNKNKSENLDEIWYLTILYLWLKKSKILKRK